MTTTELRMDRQSSAARLDEAYVLRARPPGSPRDLAVRFALAGQRPGLTALFALQAELLALSRIAIDHAVAHSRLEWWRAELERLADDSPVHPVTRALRAECRARNVALRGLEELLAAAEWDLARLTIETNEEFERYCWRSQGVVQLIGLQLAMQGATTDGIEELARALGRALGVERVLLSLDSEVRRGLVRLPLAELNARNLALEDLRASRGSSALGTYLVSLSTSALERLTAARANLDASVRRTARAQVVLAALCAAQLESCREAASRGAPFVELSPLKRVWTAWNAARRAGAPP